MQIGMCAKLKWQAWFVSMLLVSSLAHIVRCHIAGVFELSMAEEPSATNGHCLGLRPHSVSTQTRHANCINCGPYHMCVLPVNVYMHIHIHAPVYTLYAM